MGTEAKGIPAVTLGAWIALVDTRGWVEGVWLTTLEAAQAALPAVAGRLRPGEGDDLVSELVKRTRERPIPKSWRDPSRAGIALARWFGGVLKNLLLELRRGGGLVIAADVLDDALFEGEHVPAGGRRGPSPLRVRRRVAADGPAGGTGAGHDEAGTDGEAAKEKAELRRRLEEREASLTPLQREALALHLRGLTHAEAAADLGVERDTFRARLRRARRRLASGLPPPTRHDAAAAAALEQVVAAAGDTRGAAILALRAAGKTFHACAETLGRTLEAVRSHAARLWRRWRPRPEQAPGDTGVPPRTLPSEDGAPPPPERGVDDGRAPGPLARPGPVHAAAVPGGRDPP